MEALIEAKGTYTHDSDDTKKLEDMEKDIEEEGEALLQREKDFNPDDNQNDGEEDGEVDY